jgi:parallel beta-helix repeat protein
VNLRYPIDGKTFNTYDSAENITLVYNATDDYGDIFCTLYDNISGTWGEDSNHIRYVVAKNETVSVTLPDVPAGTYSWNVMCNDSSGNSAFASSNYTFTITQLTIGPCDCNSCTDCNAKMNTKSCTIVRLTQDISYSGTGACVNKTKISGEQTKTFNGQNFTITGSGSGYGIMMTSGAPMDIFMVNDISGSMNWGNKLSDAKSAAVTFLNSIVTGEHRAGLVSYAGSSSVNTGLTTTISTVVSAVNALTAPPCTGACTAIGSGIMTAVANYGAANRMKIMILLSDGGENVYPPGAISAAYYADSLNVTIYTIGLGADANANLMRNIASITGGQYYPAPNAAALQQAYKDISARFYDFEDHSIINVNISNFYTAISIGGVVRPSITYSNLSHNQIGIIVDRGGNATISYNNISSYSTSGSNWGIVIPGPVSYNKIIGNTIRTSGAGANNYGIYLNPYYVAYFNNISYNNIYTSGTTNNYGLYVYGSGAGYASNDTYSYNKIYAGGTSNYNYGIWENARYSFIDSNTIDTKQSVGASDGIYQYGATRNSISSNNITAGGYGINSESSMYNTLSYNNITSSGVGIYMWIYASYGAQYNNVTSNTINAAGDGIVFSRSGSNHVFNNSISSSNANGVIMSTNSAGNKIDSNSINVICPAQCRGIYAYDSSTGNEMYRNNIGVRGTAAYETEGIYIGYGSGASTVMYNNISTYGVSNYNIGVKVFTNSWADTISYNTINTNGSSGSSYNWGIDIQSTGGSTPETITYNNITTEGDAGNYGIFLESGTAIWSIVDYNNVIANSRGSGASIGIYIYPGSYSANTDVIGNNVSCLGRNTNGNYGIFIYSSNTGSCRVNSNIISGIWHNCEFKQYNNKQLTGRMELWNLDQ